MTTALDTRRALTPKWTKAQVDLMKRTVAKGTTDDEFLLFLYTCKRTGLDPFVKQIYAIKRWDSENNSYTMGIQVGIDGMRLIARRTNELAGIDDAKHDIDPNKTWHPATATVTVYRMQDGERIPYTHTVRWSEYVQKKKNGEPTRMWSKEGMPFNQLSKCAEAGALRKGFPNDLSGLTTADESPIIDITPEEPKQRADTQPEKAYIGQLIAHEPKNASKKTPHRLTFKLEDGGEITVGTYELPAAIKEPEKLIGSGCQFSYEEKPNPRGGEPFRNLKHFAIEEQGAPSETKKEEKNESDTGQQTIEDKAEFTLNDFMQMMVAATDEDNLEEIYTGTVIKSKQWLKYTPAQKRELSNLYGDLKKQVGK